MSKRASLNRDRIKASMTVWIAIFAMTTFAIGAWPRTASALGTDDRAYHEQDVTVTGAGDFELRGTLTLPKRAEEDEGAAFIGVLLLPGSGPTDRNGNQPPHLVTNLLREVAHELARHDVASLRFDKRAAHVYQHRWPRTTLEELRSFFSWEHFLEDAAAAFRFLQAHPRTDPDRALIFGHSEGGLIALQIADRLGGEDRSPAGLILAGTPGRTMDHLLREQIPRGLARQLDEEEMERVLKDLDRAIDAVKEGNAPPTDLSPYLAHLFSPVALDVIRAYLTVDPLEYARRYDGPALVMNGQFDAQVRVDVDLPKLRGALAEREGAKVSAGMIRAASHNFKVVESLDDPGFTGPVHRAFLEQMIGWIGEKIGKVTE